MKAIQTCHRCLNCHFHSLPPVHAQVRLGMRRGGRGAWPSPGCHGVRRFARGLGGHGGPASDLPSGPQPGGWLPFDVRGSRTVGSAWEPAGPRVFVLSPAGLAAACSQDGATRRGARGCSHTRTVEEFS